MNRLFTKQLGLNDSIRFNLPLAERSKDYKIKDIRVNAVLDTGEVVRNGFTKITCLIDQDRILDNDLASSLTGHIASMDLNQDVRATTDIELISSLIDGLISPLPVNVIGLFVSFIVSEA